MSLTQFITQLGAAGAGGLGPSTYAVVGGSMSSYSVALVDISDPTNPSIAATLGTTEGGFNRNMLGICFSDDDQYIAAGGTGGYVFMLNHTTAGSLSQSGYAASDSTMYKGQFSQSGDYLMMPNYSDGRLKLFDVSTPTSVQLQQTTDTNGEGRQISFHPDGDLFLLATDGSSGRVTLFNYSGGSSASKVTTMTDGAYALTNINGAAYSPDGNYIACARDANDGRIVLLDATTKGGALSQSDSDTLNLGTAFCVAWSPDGNYIAVGHNGPDGIAIFSHDGAGNLTFEEENTMSSPPNGVEFTADGKYIVCALDSSPYFAIVDFTSQSLGSIYTVTLSGLTKGNSVAASNF